MAIRTYLTVGALATALAALSPKEAEGQQWQYGAKLPRTRPVQSSVLCEPSTRNEGDARKYLSRILSHEAPLAVDSTCVATFDAVRPRAVRSGTDHYNGFVLRDSVAARLDFPLASVNFANGDSIFIRPASSVIGSVNCPRSVEDAASDGVLTPEELGSVRYGMPCTLLLTASGAAGNQVVYAVKPNRVLDHVASQRTWWNKYTPQRRP